MNASRRPELRFSRTSLRASAAPERVSESHLKRILSPAELKLLEVRPVATITSLYAAKRVVHRAGGEPLTVIPSYLQGAHVNKTQAKRLTLINAHCLMRVGLTLPVVPNPGKSASLAAWLNEQLVIWLPAWLDDLSNALTGEDKASLTKEAAMRRCVAAIEKTTGVKFPQPVKLTSEGVGMTDLLKTAAPAAGNKTAPKAPKAVKAPAAKAAPKASVKKAPPAITPNLGKTKAAPKAAPAKGDEDHKLTVLTDKKANPKKDKSSKAYQQFELMKKSATVGKFLAAGGSRAYLNYEVQHERVSVKK